jgi:serine/threonine-protein kinase
MILFELVIGKPPFSGASIAELALRVVMDPTPPLVGPLPRGFEAVVHRCLEKAPAKRYQDVAQLAHALAGFAGPNGPQLARNVSRVLTTPQVVESSHGPASTSVPTTMGSAVSSISTSAPIPTGGRRWGMIAGVGLLSIIAGIALGMRKPGVDPDTAAATLAPPLRSSAAGASVDAMPDAEVIAAPDAAVATTAAVPTVPEIPTDAAVEPAGRSATKRLKVKHKPPPPPPQPQPQPQPEDLGEQRK